MKFSIKAATLAVVLAGSFVLPSQSIAGSRYGTPPPLTLSPDVTSPWTLQLKPLKRRATRSERRRAKRPKGLRAAKQREFRVLKPLKRRRQATRTQRSGVTTTALRSQNKRLQRSISPEHKPELLPTVINYHGKESPGTVIINTPERRLYLVLPNGKARRYAVGVGKPGFEWSGTRKVTRKAEWPSWTPPKEMIARERKKGRILPSFMAGGPKNPMGARALYLGSTLYRIHGTNQAWSIGQAVSSGCIRMRNEDVMDLYDRVPVGARVKVI